MLYKQGYTNVCYLVLSTTLKSNAVWETGLKFQDPENEHLFSVSATTKQKNYILTLDSNDSGLD